MRTPSGRRVAAALATAAAVSLIVAACDEPDPYQVQDCVFEVRFPYDGQPILVAGDTGRLVPMSRNANGLTSPGTATLWTSSYPGVAEVDGTGLVRGLQPGFSEISADGCIGFSVEVLARPARVMLQPDTMRMLPGNRGSFGYWLRDAAGRDIALHWVLESQIVLASEAPAVVAVNDAPGSRVVTALTEGTARVTATFRDAGGSMTVIVTGATLGAPDAGAQHTCALSTDSLAYCWGNTVWLGPLEWSPGHLSGPAPVRLAGDLRFAALSSGSNHACGLKADGGLYCVGNNQYGQLGTGAQGYAVEPTRVLSAARFTTVSAGSLHTCGLASDGRVFCWGVSTAGELGSPADSSCMVGFPIKSAATYVACSRAPLAVAPAMTFSSVRAGASLTCGRSAAGELYCWGLHYGPEPVPVTGGPALDSIDLGGLPYLGLGVDTLVLACGLDPAGAAHCWGQSRYGLGDGSSTESWAPVPVAGGLTFRALSVGTGVCGITDAGAIYCWGGAPGSFAQGATPTRVPGPQTFTAVTAAAAHGCGLGTDGRVYCWGVNYEWQLGVSGPNSSTPVLVLGQR